jgi:hypothetical protein
MIALAFTERMNIDIFSTQTAPVVYLNGTLLFIAGVAILQAHACWRRDGSAFVTLTGWFVVGIGLYRMIAPEAPQLGNGQVANTVFVGLALLGAALSILGYRRAGPTK